MAEADLVDFCLHLGQVQPDPRTGETSRSIAPVGIGAAPINTLSSRYGDGEFPFHTEMAYVPTPPRYLILFCQHPGEGQRPTRYLDCAPLIRKVSNYDRTGNWVVKAGRKPFYCHAITKKERSPGIRFDGHCMEPRGSAAIRESEVIKDFFTSTATQSIVWEANDLLVLDNWRVVHARGSAIKPDTNRKIVRTLIGGADVGQQ